MKCNICDSEKFGPQGNRPWAKCLECGSFERTRLMWMYLQRAHVTPSDRVLHIAPEKGLYKKFSDLLSPEEYHCADLFPEQYKFATNIRTMDLCNLDGENSNYYDFIVHSHVLEHIPCNIAYTLFHLHRMLKPSGRHICVIPFMDGEYDECFGEMNDRERISRFGQDDHVRRFGNRDLDRHLGSIVKLPKRFDASNDFSKTILLEANIPEAMWKGFHPSTVLDLGKYDYRLSDI